MRFENERIEPPHRTSPHTQRWRRCASPARVARLVFGALLAVAVTTSGCRMLGFVPLPCTFNSDCPGAHVCDGKECAPPADAGEGEGEGEEGEGEAPTGCGTAAALSD